jgi:hypothetical protein
LGCRGECGEIGGKGGCGEKIREDREKKYLSTRQPERLQVEQGFWVTSIIEGIGSSMGLGSGNKDGVKRLIARVVDR